MTREQMEHLIRAAAALTRASTFIVVGSQALLGTAPELPPDLGRSMELDLYPAEDPSAANLIDGSIGELSPFHETFGYYAHGVGPETAQLPQHWRDRVVIWASEHTGGAQALCISPSDLAISKLLAGREKDRVFVDAMLAHGFIQKASLRALLDELTPEQRRRIEPGLGVAGGGAG